MLTFQLGARVIVMLPGLIACYHLVQESQILCNENHKCWSGLYPDLHLIACEHVRYLSPICKILHCEDSQNRHVIKFVSPELSSTHFSQLWKLWLTCEDRDGFMMQHSCNMFASWLRAYIFATYECHVWQPHINVVCDVTKYSLGLHLWIIFMSLVRDHFFSYFYV